MTWLTTLSALILAILSLAGCRHFHPAKSAASELNRPIEACTCVIESGKLSGKELSLAFGDRGYLYGEIGDYDRAVADYSRAVELDPDDEYSRIWLLLTLRRVPEALATGYREDFRAHLRTGSLPKFIRTVSKFLLGMDGVTEKGVLEEARRGKNDQEIRDRLCEAYFYLGKERAVKGDRMGAEEFFRKTVETAVYDFDEYQAAKAELRDNER